MFGLSDPAQAIGKTDFDFFTTEHAQPAYDDERAIIRTGHPLIKEEKETWANRPDTWVSSIKMPMHDGEGNVIGTYGLSVDITASKQAEQVIRQHITELEMLYESGLVLGQLLSPKEIAHKLIDLMAAKLDWHHTAIRLYHAEDETLELLAFNLPAKMSAVEIRTTEERFKTMITKAVDGLSGWAVQHRQAVRVGELADDSRYIEVEPDQHSGMYIPLKAGNALWV